MQYAVQSGWIVDGFYIDGTYYGHPGGGTNELKLDEGEVLVSVKYGRCEWEGQMVISDVSFFTNTGKKFGPFGTCNDYYLGYEGPYHVALDLTDLESQIQYAVGNNGEKARSQNIRSPFFHLKVFKT